MVVFTTTGPAIIWLVTCIVNIEQWLSFDTEDATFSPALVENVTSIPKLGLVDCK